jgi:hypothetical protein
LKLLPNPNNLFLSFFLKKLKNKPLNKTNFNFKIL